MMRSARGNRWRTRRMRRRWPQVPSTSGERVSWLSMRSTRRLSDLASRCASTAATLTESELDMSASGCSTRR